MTMMLTVQLLAAAALPATASALALHRARRFSRRTKHLEVLAEMSELMQLSSSTREAMEMLPRFGRTLFPDFDGSVYIVRSSPGGLELASWWQGNQRGTARFLTFPMLAAGESMGVLTLSGPRNQLHHAIADRFTNQIGLTLASLRLQDALRLRAMRDSLTGLFNRSYLEETLARELLRGHRAKLPVGLIVIDVDHFKKFNDTWGHSAGDALLRQLGPVMKRAFRESDVVCRFGGEEFVVIAPDSHIEPLRLRVERLRDEVRQMQVRHDGRVLAPVTLSAGIAVSPEHGLTVDALFASADRALYAAKSNGRDRVVLSPSHENVAGRDAA